MISEKSEKTSGKSRQSRYVVIAIVCACLLLLLACAQLRTFSGITNHLSDQVARIEHIYPSGMDRSDVKEFKGFNGEYASTEAFLSFFQSKLYFPYYGTPPTYAPERIVCYDSSGQELFTLWDYPSPGVYVIFVDDHRYEYKVAASLKGS